MPKNKACPGLPWVTDPITDQEIAFARLILSGTMNDRRAAEAVGLNPGTAAYTSRHENQASPLNPFIKPEAVNHATGLAFDAVPDRVSPIRAIKRPNFIEFYEISKSLITHGVSASLVFLFACESSLWTGAPCLHRQGRSTTWVEQAGAKPLPMRTSASSTHSIRCSGRFAKLPLTRRIVAPPNPSARSPCRHGSYI